MRGTKMNLFIMCDFSKTLYRNDEAAGWLLSPVHRRLNCVAIHQTPYIVPIHRDWGLDLFGFSLELIIVTLLLLAAWRTQRKTSDNTNRKSRTVISILSKTAAILFVAAVIAVTCIRLLHGARVDSL